MSDSPIPRYVDARKVFIQKGCVSGFIAPGQLEQLKTMIVGQEGRVRVEIYFTLDDFGRKRIAGNLNAEVNVVCQRCLEPVPIQLTDEIDLVVVASEDEAKVLDMQFDPWILTGNKVDLASMIDEQLVLCMPIVCYHQEGACSKKPGYSTSTEKADEKTSNRKTTNNPFAVLKTFKKQ